MDRHKDVVEVLATRDDAHVGTIALNGPHDKRRAGPHATRRLSGDLVFVALRGPTPLSGRPAQRDRRHAGLGVIEVTEGGRSGRLKAIVRLTNVGEDGVERADPTDSAFGRLP